MLERLISRGSSAVRIADWRADAFGILTDNSSAAPAVAAAALAAVARAPPGASVYVATPVHLSAGMSTVTMPLGGILGLEEHEARSLVADFDRVFDGSGARLCMGRAAALLCVIDRVIAAVTHDPALAVGRDVFAFQPSGPDGARLRRLMSEIEMWLHDQPLNRLRAAQLMPAVTGLWLWGGGPVEATLPSIRGWTAGDDPIFSAFGDSAQFVSDPPAGVVVCGASPGAPGWTACERQWLQPAAAALRSKAISTLMISAGQRRITITARFSWRVWRRVVPWWTSFGLPEELHDDQ
ncbi:MAG: hypothetical protein NVSMB10_00350 [Steroidobacteraceae bacterium]